MSPAGWGGAEATAERVLKTAQETLRCVKNEFNGAVHDKAQERDGQPELTEGIMRPDTEGPNVIYAAGEDRSREPPRVLVPSIRSEEKRKLRTGQKFARVVDRGRGPQSLSELAGVLYPSGVSTHPSTSRVARPTQRNTSRMVPYRVTHHVSSFFTSRVLIRSIPYNKHCVLSRRRAS